MSAEAMCWRQGAHQPRAARCVDVRRRLVVDAQQLLLPAHDTDLAGGFAAIGKRLELDARVGAQAAHSLAGRIVAHQPDEGGAPTKTGDVGRRVGGAAQHRVLPT